MDRVAATAVWVAFSLFLVYRLSLWTVFHSVALSPSGEVYTWGDGGCGQLGHGDEVLSQPVNCRT